VFFFFFFDSQINDVVYESYSYNKIHDSDTPTT